MTEKIISAAQKIEWESNPDYPDMMSGTVMAAAARPVKSRKTVWSGSLAEVLSASDELAQPDQVRISSGYAGHIGRHSHVPQQLQGSQ